MCFPHAEYIVAGPEPSTSPHGSQDRRLTDLTSSDTLQPTRLATQRYVFRTFCNQNSSEFTKNGTPKILYSSLGIDNTRPLGVTGSSRLQNRTCNCPNAAVSTSYTMPVFDAGNCVESGGRGFVRKTSSSSSPRSSSRAGIYKFYVCSPQERRGKSPSSQSEASEPVSSVRALLNGGHPHVEGFTNKGGFSGKNRPQGYLSDGAYLERPPKISTFCLEELPHGVLLSPFRFSNSTKGVYKTYETSRRGPKTKRDSFNYIFRRHINNGESYDLALQHAASTLNLLEGLGFIVNYQKSQLKPCQELEFLGFLINSNTLSLQLPGEKLRKIRKKCQQLLDQTTISVRELSKFLGLLTSSIQAIFPAPLHYRHLQSQKIATLASLRTYKAELSLNPLARAEILWWRDHLHAWNGRSIL